MPDDPIVAVVKVLPKGAVQLPPEVRERLGLKPGMKLIMITVDDALLIRRAAILVRQPGQSIVRKLKSVFSKIPIANLEG